MSRQAKSKATRPAGTSPSEFRFTVKLKHSKRIERTVVLRGDQTLDDLHAIMFEAFDRFDEHLYCFYFPKAPGRRSVGPAPKEYGAPELIDPPDPFGGGKQFDAAQTRIDALRLKVGQQFEYLFDFGDCWWHQLQVQAIGPTRADQRYPAVVEKRGESPGQYESTEE